MLICYSPVHLLLTPDGEYLNFVSLQEAHLILGSLASGMNLIHMLSEFARSIPNYRNHAFWLFRPYR